MAIFSTSVYNSCISDEPSSEYPQLYILTYFNLRFEDEKINNS